LNNPSTYEILRPEDFGMTRYVSIGHRLTGWNAVKNRVQQLGLDLTDEQVKEVTAQIKRLADVRDQSVEDVDLLLKQYHRRFAGDEPLIEPVHCGEHGLVMNDEQPSQ
jgi:homocitrate synthase